MNRPIDLRPLCAALALGVLLAACGRAPEPAEPSPPAGAEAAAECVRTPPAEPMVCTMDWRPVCGCDGITYPNACSARAAGVTDFSDGECAADAAARRD